MSEPKEKVKASPAAQVAGGVAALFGALLGKYAGLFMLIPFVGALVAGLLAKKLASQAAQPMVPAFAVQAGHLMWLAIGLALVGKVDLNLVDVALLAGGLAWLLAAPGLWPVLLLAVYQLFSLAVNGWVFIHAELGSTQHRALAVHLSLRVLALVLLFVGLRAFRRVGK